ncbi:hypothetical protein [Arcicella aurantiaca]|nr:hypothetical protein [Arcicella aurantiaca]
MSILFMNLFIISSYAQQTKKISLQGFLKDGNGKAVADGNQEMIFKLYPSKEGGTAEWEETQTINVFGGVYSTHLGKNTPLDNLSWGTKTYYVGVTVQGSELNPRTELTFAPYSLGSPSADVANTVKCSGAVGDIKYSILNPTQFATVNGNCWVPMDGRALAVADKLREIIPTMANIPDGSGAFLRSQEFEGKADRDKDRTSATAIAVIQDEGFKSHNHENNLSVTTTINSGGNHSHSFYIGKNSFQDGDGRQVVEHAGTDNNSVSGDKSLINTTTTGDHSHTATSTVGGSISSKGGTETRPVNLNFWIYIRIN